MSDADMLRMMMDGTAALETRGERVFKAEVERLRHICWQVEDLCWDKLAAEGEHGDEHLEARLNIPLHSVMIRVDPDGEIFQKPYKIQPKVLEVEQLRALTSEVDLGGVAVYRLVGREAERVSVAELLTEFERLRADKDEAIALMVKAQRKAGELEAENAELRANHDSSPCAGCIAVADQNDALKATLDWFEETWPFVQAIVDADYDDIEHQDALLDRLRASPEPTEGT